MTDHYNALCTYFPAQVWILRSCARADHLDASDSCTDRISCAQKGVTNVGNHFAEWWADFAQRSDWWQALVQRCQSNANIQAALLVAAALFAASLLLAVLRAVRRALGVAWTRVTGPDGPGRASWHARALAALLFVFGADILTAEQRGSEELRTAEALRDALVAQQAEVASITQTLEVSQKAAADLDAKLRHREEELAELRSLAGQNEREAANLLTLAQRKLAIMEELVSAMKDRLQSESARALQLQQEGDSLREDVAAAKEAAESRAAQLQEELTGAQRMLDITKAELAGSASQAAQLGAEAASLRAEAQREAARYESEALELRARATDALAQVQDLTGNVQRLEAKLADSHVRLTLAENREEDLLRKVNSAGASLDQAQGGLERVEVELHTARRDADEARAKALEVTSQLAALQSEVASLRESMGDVAAKLEASEAQLQEALRENARLAEGVEELRGQLAAEQARSLSLTEDLKAEQQQSGTELRAQKERLAELSAESHAARLEAAAAKERYGEVQRELSAAVAGMLSKASQPTFDDDELTSAMDAVTSATGGAGDVAVWWALTTGELQTLQAEKQRRTEAVAAELQRIKRIVCAQMRERDAEEVAELQAAVEQIQQQREALVLMRDPTERARKDAQLAAEEEQKSAAVEVLYSRALQPDARRRHSALLSEQAETRAFLKSLDAALALPLQRRLELVLAQRVAVLRKVMRREVDERATREDARVAAAEAEVQARAAARLAEAEEYIRERERAADAADAAAQARAHELLERTEAEIQAREVEQRAAAAAERQALAVTEAAARERVADADAATAAAERATAAAAERAAAVDALVAEYGPLSDVAAKSAQLQALETSLRTREEGVAAGEATVRESRAQLDAEAVQLKERMERLESSQAALAADREALSARTAQLQAREAELEAIRKDTTGELRKVQGMQEQAMRNSRDWEAHQEQVQAMAEQQLAAARRKAEDEIAAARDKSARELKAAKERAERELADIRRVAAQEASEAELLRASTTSEPVRLRAEVQQKNAQIAALKERFAAQLSASTQQATVAQEKMRILREQVAQRDALISELQPDGVRFPDAASAAPSSGAATASSADGTRGSAAGPAKPESELFIEDMSQWASTLLTNLITDSPGGARSRANQSAPAGPRHPRADAALDSSAAAAAAPERAAGQTATLEAQVTLLAAAASIPHPDKVEKGGEDAYFISSAGALSSGSGSGCGAVGVADGVGGWGETGIDPALYAQDLMKHSQRFLAKAKLADENACVAALQHAHGLVDVQGSSTAVLARLVPGGVLEVANLGDSGVRILRNGAVIWKSSVLQHQWNMPFQLGNPALLPETDRPADAQVDRVQCQVGDLIVMGSDGLFDNMWDKDICALVEQAAKQAGGGRLGLREVEALSQKIARVAEEHSRDKMFKSPWSVECAENRAVGIFRKLFPKGGKLDDITVIVAAVV